MPKYKKIGVLLLGDMDNSEKIVNLLQDNGYAICIDDQTEDGIVLGILEEGCVS